MSIHTLAILFAVIILGAVVFFIKTRPEPQQLTAKRIGLLAMLLLAIGYMFSATALKDQVNYRQIATAEIFLNEADREYYFNHQGKVISMLDACDDQYPDKVPPSRVRSIPEVKVYERTYLPTLGIVYAQKDLVYVHGYDARIDQSIELK